MSATKDAPSRHSGAGRMEKALATDTEARRITAAEAAARIKKTEKLRALRMEQAAQEQPVAVETKSRKKAKS